MNLELLDPFGRQIPDRVDATVHLPAPLHFRHHEVEYVPPSTGAKGGSDGGSGFSDKGVGEQEWKAAYHVSFNRRGTYLAVGFGSGAVGVFNVLSRTLCALYRSDDKDVSPDNLGNGVTSVTWSRQSRSLLAGAAGDTEVHLFDTTHPYGPEESCLSLFMDEPKDGKDNDKGGDDVGASMRLHYEKNPDIPLNHQFDETKYTSFVDADNRFTVLKERRVLTEESIRFGQEIPPQNLRSSDVSSDLQGLTKFHCASFNFPHPVGGTLQVNPRRPTAGLAALVDGSLVLFWFHPSVWVHGDRFECPKAMLIPLVESTSSSRFITCAAFDPHGDRVYAATKDGTLLGFDVSDIWDTLSNNVDQARKVPDQVEPSFAIKIPGGSSAWHLLLSRNGKYLVVNSADGALRLYATQPCWEDPKTVEKPTWVFQDVVSKVKFASCDLSGDGEYVVGGANGDDNKYELYIWNTSTGVLMDKVSPQPFPPFFGFHHRFIFSNLHFASQLTGPSVQLYSVAWHPTRSFLAVATSDGLVDVWGPRINWTAFAPDFQALPMNVEYVECEDEFDRDKQGRHQAVDKESNSIGGESNSSEDSLVDVTTIEPVPVFASDSEGEEDVFYFETRIKDLMARRGRAGKAAAADD